MDKITLKEFPGLIFDTKELALKHLVENQKVLIAQKKATLKMADSVGPTTLYLPKSGDASKQSAESVSLADATRLKVRVVGNACNYLDSHGDVSIKGSWTRTAKNTKDGMVLKEHVMKFDNLLSDEVEFKIGEYSWKDLGYGYEGKTETLDAEFIIEKNKENADMFDRYVAGRVKNHSAGLRYVKIALAINSEEDWAKREKAVWDKYYNEVVNKGDLDEVDHFWAIEEQKIVEVSAVVKGSNPATPTILVESAESTSANQEKASPEGTPKTKIFTNFY